MANYSKEELARFGLTAELAAELQPEDYDPNAMPTGPQVGPLPDGNHNVIIRLAEPRKEGETNPQVRKGQQGLFATATFEVRHYRPENEERPLGQYLNSYTANSIRWDNQPTSDLVALCAAVGQPAPRGLNPLGLAQHVASVFNAAPEEGLPLQVFTQWEMSYQEADANGMPVINEKGQNVWTRIKGERKIKEAAAAGAAEEAAAEGLDPATTQQRITEAVDNCTNYVDPVSGKERTVRASISRIVGQVR